MAAAVARGLRAEGFAVDVAGDGGEALWFAGENEYDAIVLDVMLPVKNGYLVCRELREAGNWTPILMLTAKDGELDEAEALDTGADDFLSKPFSYVVLLARLRSILRRGRAPRPVALKAGDLVLDPVAHSVGRAGNDIALSARQFALLEFLMSRAGETLSKEAILGHVWDFAFDGDPNIVEVYVAQLRKRIDTPFGRRAITTVRGAGYRLEPDGG